MTKPKPVATERDARARFDFTFLGAFCLTGPGGRRIHVRSKKGIALLAMLATADRGERSRGWLQQKLWGSRELPHAQNSLRRELARLRTQLNGFGAELLQADQQMVRLDLAHANVDVRDPLSADDGAEFLEGLDLPGQFGFREWLAEARGAIAARRRQGQDPAEGGARWDPARPPTLALALAVMPVAGEPALADELAHLLVKCLTARKWLPIHVPRSLVARSADAEEDSTLRNARYVLEGRIVSAASSARLVLDLKARPGAQLLWTETLTIDDEIAGNLVADRVGRLCNAISHAVFYAEFRRIQALPREELNASELTHLAAHQLTLVSVDHLAQARADLDHAVQLGGWSAERVILDANIKVLSFMASDYGEVDHASLRTWASQAMTADPTGWRGPMLASLVELWLGNPALAIAHARTAEDLCPANSSILGQLGIAHLWNGQPDLAVAELDSALALLLLDRRPYLVLCNLALAHLTQDRLGQALAFCDQAASCIPELGLAYLLKIEILIRLDRLNDAARVYRESIRDNFDDLIGLVRRQRVLPPAWIPRMQESMEIAAATAARLEPQERGAADA